MKTIKDILKNITDCDGGLVIYKDGVCVDFTINDIKEIVKKAFDETMKDKTFCNGGKDCKCMTDGEKDVNTGRETMFNEIKSAQDKFLKL